MSQFYPPVIGGVERHVAALARGLAARGHEVAVATLTREAEAEAAPAAAIRTLPGTVQRFSGLFTTDRRHAPPVPDPEASLALRSLLAEFRPHVVHAHNWLGRSFVPLKRRGGPRYVVTLHDCSRTCAQGRRMFAGVTPCDEPGTGRCLRCAAAYYGPAKGAVTLAGNALMRPWEAATVDRFIAVSTAIARVNRLDADGLPHEVIPNFLEDAPVPAPAIDASGLPAEPFILQVGDVVEDKGVGVLFEAYRALDRPVPLVLIGRADSAMAAAAPPGAAVLGPRSHEFVRAAWSRALFGTIPSLCIDASPTVTLEAMAAGRPVVASAVGGLTDQVDDGATGLLVPPGDAGALRDAMRRLIDDAGMRERMGAAARERLSAGFAADVVIDRIEAVYFETLA